MLHDSFMSRPNNIVVPGGKMGLAMQLIFTPMILRLMDSEAPRAVMTTPTPPQGGVRPPRGAKGTWGGPAFLLIPEN